MRVAVGEREGSEVVVGGGGGGGGGLVPPQLPQSVQSVPLLQYVGSSQYPSFAHLQELSLPPLAGDETGAGVGDRVGDRVSAAVGA